VNESTGRDLQTETESGLVRALGPGMAIAMVVGNVIGTGIYAKPVEIAPEAGNVTLIAWAWIAGGIVSLVGGLCFAELAVMYPKAGGIYVYLREAYGRAVAFLFGWSEFVFGRPASIGAYCILLTYQLEAIYDVKLLLWPRIGVSLTAIAIIAALNVRGVIWGGRVQGLTTLLRCLTLIVLAALPFVLTAGGHVGFVTENLHTTMDVGDKTVLARFAVVLLAVSWAYNGWHGVCPIAEEVRRPERNILIALFVGIAIIIAIYGLINLSYHGSMSLEEISQAGYQLPQEMVKKLLSPVSPNLAQFGSLVISVTIALSLVGGINVNLMNGPRVAFAVGRDEPAIERFGETNKRFHTPAFSIVFQAVMSVLMMVVVGVFLEFQGKGEGSGIFITLTNYVVFSANIFYILTVGAILIMRRTAPDKARPFRVPLYPVLPLAWILFNTWFLYQIFIGNMLYAGISIVLSLIGLPLWWALQR
jgi:APA family basic amino acid/polyamine antiporter